MGDNVKSVTVSNSANAQPDLGWFDQDRRKIHILYVCPEWTKDRACDLDAEAYAENLSRAGIKMVELYTKDHHGYVYYKCKTGRAYPRDIVAELLAACHKRHIKLMAYYSVAFDNYAAGLYPEWLQCDRDGQFREYGFTRMLCLNSPYCDFALEQIHELVSKYDIDGLWLDIMPVSWHEFKKIGWEGDVEPFCYCYYCRQKYQATYNRDVPMDPNLEETLDGFHMQVEGAERFLKGAKKILRQYRPAALLTYNGSGVPEDPLTIGDVITVEGHPPAYYHESMLVRWAQGQNRPMEMLSAGALSGWNGWDLKPISMLQLETAIALSHGCGVTFGQQPLLSGNPQEADFTGLQELFNWVSKLEQYTRNAVLVRDIGIYLSIKNWHAPQLGVFALGETEGIHTVLMRDQWQYDILKDLHALESCKLVIVGDHRAMSDGEVAMLRAYVQDGGRLLVTGLTGLYDEHGKKRNDFALADVIGVSYVDVNRYPEYYTDQIPQGLVKGQAFKVNPNGARTLSSFLNPETIWTKGTTVLWQGPGPDIERRYPLVTMNQFGKGRCIYIAASIGNTILGARFGNAVPLISRQTQYLDTYPARILTEAIAALQIEPSVITTALGTEVVLCRQKANHILHLINHTAGSPLWLSNTDHREMRGIEVAIKASAIGNATKAKEIATGRDVDLVSDGEWVRFQAPPYRVSSAILIHGSGHE